MASIDIKTTQNVSIEYELAPIRDRMLAFIIDFFIVAVIYLVLFFALLSAFSNTEFGNSMGINVIYGLLPIIIFLFYHLISELLTNGQSWGKKAIGIRVVRLDGREPGLADYVLRAIFHIVDTVTSGGIIAALLVSTSAKNQRLGDLTANTTVIRVRENQRFKLGDILNIHTLEDYEPQYPAVKKLSEQDMLLVKNVVIRYQAFHNKAHRDVVLDLVNRLQQLLDIDEIPQDKIAFLKTLIRDYIVLTR